jgi:hypothetical protein
MAGGSLAVLPHIEASGFLESASGMTVKEAVVKGMYQLQNRQGESIIYCTRGITPEPDLENIRGKFHILRINPIDGTVIGKEVTVGAGRVVTIPSKGTEDVILWVRKFKHE